MSQHINLYAPSLSKRRRFFSARVMLVALVALLVVAALLGVYEMLQLQQQTQVLSRTLQTQLQTLGALDLTTRQSQAAVVPAELALAQDLAARRAELLQLENTRAELQQGVFPPGEGFAAQLALVARSIPASAWLTLVKADTGRFEVSGFTFEPAALNAWIDQLADSPLLAGQRLAAVNVTKVSEPGTSTSPSKGTGTGIGIGTGTGTGTGIDSARVEPVPPVWSFTLVNALDRPLAVAGERP